MSMSTVNPMQRSVDVVLTGMGATTPLGGDVAALWQGVLHARSGIRRVDDLLTGYPHAADLHTWLGAPLAVDPATRLTRLESRRLDRCQQAALVAAREAWADAGTPAVEPERLAVVAGTAIGGVTTLLEQDDVLEQRGPRRISPLTVPMLMPNGPAATISIDLGAKAGVYSTVSACAAGAEAIVQGARLIAAGEADVVVAGGAEASLTPLGLAGFGQARTLSRRDDDPDTASRPFDAHRDGFVLGEGAGMIVLERADFAAARGARVLAHLAGFAVTSDAYHVAVPDPSGAGQIRAIRAAVSAAGLDPTEVGHVNCHATSTVAGDPVEAEAVRTALGDHVLLTAPKGSLGHLLGAAGAVESIITVLTLAHGLIPPTRNLTDKDSAVKLDVVTGQPREHRLTSALSNSFGFGGQNVALLFTRGPF